MKRISIKSLFAAGIALMLLITVTHEMAQASDASVVSKKIKTQKGGEICFRVHPITQCPRKFSDCETPPTFIDEIPIADVFFGPPPPGGHPDIKFSIPGQICPTFIYDNGQQNTQYICVGGVCYEIPGP